MANRERRRETHASKSFQTTELLTSLPKPKDRHSKTALLLAIPLQVWQQINLSEWHLASKILCRQKRSVCTGETNQNLKNNTTTTHTKQKDKQKTRQDKTKQDKTRPDKTKHTKQNKTTPQKTKQNRTIKNTHKKKNWKQKTLMKIKYSRMLFLHIYCMDYQWLVQVFGLTYSTHSLFNEFIPYRLKCGWNEGKKIPDVSLENDNHCYIVTKMSLAWC